MKPFFCAFLLSLSASALAQTESETANLTIEITKGKEDPVKIAVIPFTVSSDIVLPQSIHDILLRDLRISGQFTPIPVDKMPLLPVNESQVQYKEWQQIDAEYLLMANISRDAKRNEYKIEYVLFDIFGSNKIRNELLFFTQSSIRDTAHFLADIVYEEITGVKGIFSTKIAYITISGKRSKDPIFRLEFSDIDGLRPQVLLSSRQPILSPTWSPDGSNIAYVSFERGKSNIYIQHLRSGKRRLVSDFRGLNGSPSWSPDGSKLALVLSRRENVDVYILNIFSGKFNRLTENPEIDTEPSWSPDGKKLLFVSERKGRPHIFEANFTTKTTRQVTTKGNYNTRPRYIENGKGMVYIKLIDGQYKLVKRDFITGEEIQLSQTSSDESPSVAPNGNLVVYSTRKNAKSLLIVVSVNGQIEYQLPSSGEVIDPAWSNYRI